MPSPLRLRHALVLAVTLVAACDASDPSERGALDPGASAVAAPDILANAGTGVIPATANIWVGDSEAQVDELLGRAAAVGIHTFRLAGTEDHLMPEDRDFDQIRLQLDRLRQRGVLALFAPGAAIDWQELQGYDPDVFYDHGYATRVVLDEYRDVVLALTVFNEPELRYRDALRDGLPNPEQVIDAHVDALTAYIEGVRAAEQAEGLPRIRAFAPTFGEPFQPSYAAPFYEAYFDLIDRGLLDGLALNLYTSNREYEVIDATTVDRERSSEAAFVESLWTTYNHAPVTIIVPEAGCQADGFSTDAQDASCWAQHLADVSSIPQVKYVGVWSVDTKTLERYRVEPGTPIGDAVAAWANGQ